MDVNELIEWLVSDSVSISDPAFLARCFVVLCVIFIFSSLAHDVMTMGRG